MITDHKPLLIITGGTGFVGKACATEFINNKWQVVSLSRTGKAEDGIVSYQCDITNFDSVQEKVTEIVSLYGPIHACIHAAATPLARKSIIDTPFSVFNETISVSVIGAHNLAVACVPYMKQHSTFIGVTSEAIETSESIPSLGAYIPAKYALRGFLRVLSKDLLSRNIRVYAVAPGFLNGGLNSDLPDKVLNFMSQKLGTDAVSSSELAKYIFTLCVNLTNVSTGTSIQFPSLKEDRL